MNESSCEICQKETATGTVTCAGEKRAVCRTCWGEAGQRWIETQYSTVQCAHCKADVDYRLGKPEPKHCPRCIHKKKKCAIKSCANLFIPRGDWDRHCSKECQQEEYRLMAEAAEKEFFLSIPVLYQSTEPHKLPNPRISELIFNWKDTDDKFWLYVFGYTGAGKTRTIYHALRRFAYRHYKITVVRANEFRHEIVERTRPLERGEERIGKLSDYLDELRDGIVWFEEIDKLKFSERVADEFFDLLEYRAVHSLITIFSGKSSTKDLLKKLPPDYGAQIIRRIVQNSTIVAFPVPKVKAAAIQIEKPQPSESSINEIENDEHEEATEFGRRPE